MGADGSSEGWATHNQARYIKMFINVNLFIHVMPNSSLKCLLSSTNIIVYLLTFSESNA